MFHIWGVPLIWSLIILFAIRVVFTLFGGMWRVYPVDFLHTGTRKGKSQLSAEGKLADVITGYWLSIFSGRELHMSSLQTTVSATFHFPYLQFPAGSFPPICFLRPLGTASPVKRYLSRLRCTRIYPSFSSSYLGNQYVEVLLPNELTYLS